MKKYFLLLSTLFVMIILSSCSPELSDYMIIKGFGIDYKNDEFTVTVRYIDANVPEGENNEKNFTVVGDTVFDALNKISLSSGQIPLYSSADYIVYGKGASQNGLNDAMDFFVRYFKAKPSVSVYISSEEASSILEFEKNDDLLSSETILNTTDNKENQGKTVENCVMDFINDMLGESKSALVPLLEIKEDEIIANRSAVFYDYKLVDTLDEDMTKAFLAISGELKNQDFVVEDVNGGDITLEIMGANTKIKSEINDDKVSFTTDIELKVVIASVPLNITDLSYEDLEKSLEEQYKQLIEKCFSNKMVEKSDFFGFSEILYREETDFYKEHKNMLIDTFEKDFLTVNISTDFIKTGEENTFDNNEVEGV